jgi:predicted Zn-dependent peptidase
MSISILKNLRVERHEATLRNGIRVVLFHREHAPVRVVASLTSGSRYDRPDLPGIAHFIEHMITNGSARFPTKDVLAEHIESVGGSYGASTGLDAMNVHTEISDKEDIDRVIDIFDATLCHPLMDKEVFENEKNVVIKEIQKYNSIPSRLLLKTVRATLQSNTPYSHEVVGTEASITALTYEDMMSEYRTLFDASRIQFVASGDISIAELTNALERLQFLGGHPYTSEAPSMVPGQAGQITATFFDAPQTHIAFGVPAPRIYTKETLHLSLLGSILAGGRNSRLTKALRYNRGLVYSVRARHIGGIELGTWAIVTDTTEHQVQEVVNEIIKELTCVLKEGIKQSELDFVKHKIIKSRKRTMQTSEDWVSFHSLGETYAPQTYRNIDAYVNEVEQTTIEDIQHVIDTYLKPEYWKLVMVGRTPAESVKIVW